MIPKVIHYCWFGRNPLPPFALKCIESWKKFLPDYEIIEWNEDNFNVNMIPYTKEAYEAKKYAFVSDYARFWILYHYGGIYFDTDVEVICKMDDIISCGSFMGREAGSFNNNESESVAPGLGLGAIPGLVFYKKILEKYSTLKFVINGILNQTTVVKYTSDLLNEYQIKHIAVGVDLVEGIYIYSSEYFCPLDYHTGKTNITTNTRTIHHYSATWRTPREKLKHKIITILGSRLTSYLVNIKHFIVGNYSK